MESHHTTWTNYVTVIGPHRTLSSIPGPTKNHSQPQNRGPACNSRPFASCHSSYPGFSAPTPLPPNACSYKLFPPQLPSKFNRNKLRHSANHCYHMLMNTGGSGSGSNSNTMLRECDSCRSAQAAVYCRADLAYLCAGCDADIHTANPISRRHHRVPVLSNYGEAEYVDEEGNHNKYEALFGEEVDEYLDLVGFNSCTEDRKQIDIKNEVSECVGSVQCGVLLKKDYEMEMEMEMEMQMQYETSNAGFSYSNPLSHSVSLSSMEASRIVPDNTVTDISNSYIQPSKGNVELFPAPLLNVPSQFTPMDREARVLRYREKKKTRKFEKTIRYASRKAYAEARPRIKGRFAKRSDVELEVDQMFSNYVFPEDSYGIVPSF